MRDVSTRQIIMFLFAGILLAFLCSLAISKKLADTVSMESRTRDLSMVFGAIEAGPLAIARLQSSAISQEQLTLLMTNSELSGRGFISAKIIGGPTSGYTFANWNSPNPATKGCTQTYEKSFNFADALNPFKIVILRDDCFVVSEQKQILVYSSSATLLVTFVTLILLSIVMWPVASSIKQAEESFADRFKSFKSIPFRPIRLLVREGIRNVELEKEQALTSLAQQVSHDIRSPLTALQMAVKVLTEIPEDKANIIRDATERIRTIADSLINKRREAHVDSPSQTQLKSNLEKLISEKRMEILDRPNITLIVDIPQNLDVLLPVTDSDLNRILSNLLNNSIEAIESAGTVTLGVRTSRNETEIIVSDDGKGIPKILISKLGEQSVTHGKLGGTGMGLLNARRIVESVGGRLIIQSKESVGTLIKLSFPS